VSGGLEGILYGVFRIDVLKNNKDNEINDLKDFSPQLKSEKIPIEDWEENFEDFYVVCHDYQHIKLEEELLDLSDKYPEHAFK